MKALLFAILLVSAPVSVTCPEDNLPMYPDGRTKSQPGGIKLCEYAHEVRVPSSPQPYDPTNPHPYTAPRVIKHTAWVRCD